MWIFRCVLIIHVEVSYFVLKPFLLKFLKFKQQQIDLGFQNLAMLTPTAEL